MAKSTSSNQKSEDKPTDANDDMRRGILERQLKDSKAAFSQWQTASDRSDKALYQAIGHLAEFVASVGNDSETLIAFASDKGVKLTKATSAEVAVTKMVITDDKSKSSKYASVLKFVGVSGIEPVASEVAEFIASTGGIEACLKEYRTLKPKDTRKPGAGRPSKYGQAISQLEGMARIAAPSELDVNASDDGYFVMIGMRDEDGTLHFIQKSISDEAVIKAAVSSLGKKISTSEIAATKASDD